MATSSEVNFKRAFRRALKQFDNGLIEEAVDGFMEDLKNDYSTRFWTRSPKIETDLRMAAKFGRYEFKQALDNLRPVRQ